MKRFLVHDLRLLSRREHSARKIEFHPKATVLKGENDTGKSSILKSVPWCLGAEPAKKNSDWLDLDIVAALRFSVDGTQYTALRHQNQFAIFDQDNRVIISTNSVSRGLGPYLAKLVEFELTLTDRDNEPMVPPPAFWLLPFYTDQDHGWKGSWCSFDKLGQFKDFKASVAEYHIGFRSNLYYRLTADLSVARAGLDQPRLQERALVRAIEQVRIRLARLSVDFDIERFQAEVAELVVAAGGLADEEEKYRRKVGELSSQRTFYAHQIDIANRTLRELSGDYKLANEQPIEIECPTCGAMYDNNISERFRIALDQHECERLVIEVQVKLGEVVSELNSQREKMAAARQRHEHVWRLLNTKREAMSLQEILRGEARGQALEAIQAEVDAVRTLISQLEEQIELLRDQIKALDSKERRDAFHERFWGTLHSNCISLRVRAPTPIRSFAPTLNETGSDLPRLVLAHNFAVLSMAWETGTCAHGPIILDSPHQQDPDPINRKTVCDFIKARVPQDGQLILALVDPSGVDFGGTVIELTKARAMLDPSAYRTVGDEVTALLQLMYEAAASGNQT